MKNIDALVADAKTEGLRHFLQFSGRCAPGLTGRWTTNMFLATRPAQSHGVVCAPLGAAVIRLDGQTGVEQAYVWGKKGPLVFLIHGWGADTGAMCSLVRPLREQGLRVVAIDAPAHGANKGAKTTMTRFVAAVRDVLERFEPHAQLRAVVGHSLGGLATVAAVATARRTPQRLVLISAPSSLNEALRSFVSFWKLPNHVERGIRRELTRSHGVPIEHWDVRTLVHRENLPTLVIHDRDDTWVPWTESRAVAEALGRTAKTELTSGLGHARILADGRITSLVGEFVANESAAAA